MRFYKESERSYQWNMERKEKAILSPTRQRTDESVKDHAAFGMWRDRKDMADVDAYVRNLRN